MPEPGRGAERACGDGKHFNAAKCVGAAPEAPAANHALTARAGLRSPNDHFDELQWSTKLTFWGVQFVYTFVTLALVPFMHASQKFHAAVLLAFFAVSVYNGRRSGDVTAGTGPELTRQ